jgi:putative GTP pyrophosphokinase
MADEQRTAQEWAQSYADQWPLYDAFTQRLAALVEELLRGAGIGFVQVERRAKRVRDFEEKVTRKQGQYEDPLVEITDLAGIRPIVYYASDVDRVAKLLRDEFAIDIDNSLSTVDRLEDDRFGYASDHYVIRLGDARIALGEWKPYAGLVAEVQIRTVLQHAWAAIDHRLNYKSSAQIPRELKRRLFRVSALLEVADDQFEAVRIASEALSDRYGAQVQAGNLDLEVDAASVPLYAEKSDVAVEWIAVGRELGYEVHHTLEEEPGSLIEASQLAGFTTIRDLDTFLRGASPWGRQALTEVDPSNTGYASDYFLLALLVIVGAPTLDLEKLFNRRTRYTDDFKDAIRRTRALVLDQR